MTTVLIEHDVADFKTWKKNYDQNAPTRQRYGIKNDHVYQEASRPNHVCVTCEFTDLQSLERFMADPHLKEAMEKGGVQGKPEVRVLETPELHIV